MKKNRVNEFTKNPKGALLKLSIPILIAMLVQTLYNIVDTAYVGRLGSEAIAALTFAFPLFFLMMAVNVGISTGMGSKISRFLGAKNKTAAENTAMHGLLISLIVSIVLFILGIVFLNPVFSVFGAEGNVLTLSTSYMKIILYGVFFMGFAHIINNIFIAQGDTKTPMIIQICALCLNMILDPILIYGFGYGVKGAALATTISFGMSFVLSLYFITKRSYLHLKVKSFNFSSWITWQIFKVGFPASLTMMIMSVYIVFQNKFMVHFGTEYVAAIGISARLESVAVLPIVALSISLITLVGMFYGAKRYDLVKSISWTGIKTGIIFTVIMGVILFAFPTLFLRIFTSETKLLEIGSAYIRIIVFMFPLMAIGMNTSRILQGIGMGFPGLVLTLLRTVIVAIPLAYFLIFVKGYGYLSLAISMVIGGLVAAFAAMIWIKQIFSRMS